MTGTYLANRISGYKPSRPIKVGIVGGLGVIGKASRAALSQRADKAGFEIRFISDILPCTENSPLQFEGKPVEYINAADAASLPLAEVDFVIDCTNAHKQREDFEPFAPEGVKLIFPSFSAQMDANLVMGFNEGLFDPAQHQTVGIGSCSINAVVTALDAVKNLGLKSLSLHILHCVDSDQELADLASSFHTGASGSLANLSYFFPSLKDNILARHTRIPALTGMQVDCVVELEAPCTKGVRRLLEAAAEEKEGLLRIVGKANNHSRICLDAPESAIVNIDSVETARRLTSLTIWQNPHFGFSHRIWDMIIYMASRMHI